MKKTIEPGAFRALGDDECRVLFIRHADHKSNVTLLEEAARLRNQGAALKDAGITISASMSSPADRAITAVYETKAGMGVAGYTRTDDRLADLTAADPIRIAQLKEQASKAGIPAEEYIFTFAEKEPGFASTMIIRGTEGAMVLMELASANPGKTVIAGSHGGSRMEISILALRGAISEELGLTRPEVFIDRGQIVELIIKSNGILIEEYYLEMPPQPPGVNDYGMWKAGHGGVSIGGMAEGT